MAGIRRDGVRLLAASTDLILRSRAAALEGWATGFMVRDGATRLLTMRVWRASAQHLPRRTLERRLAAPTDLILRSIAKRCVSKDGHGLSWFETALSRLLTMRVRQTQ
jgi:hypothetical protein